MQFLGHSLSIGLFPLNVAVASLVVGFTAIVVGRVVRRSALPLRHGLLCAALVLTLASPLLVWIASNCGVGIVPISLGSTLNSDSSMPMTQSIGEVSLPVQSHELLESSRGYAESNGASERSAGELAPALAPANSVSAVSNVILTEPLTWSSVETIRRVSVLLLLVWAAVALWFVVRLVRGLSAIHQLRRSLRPTTDPRLIEAALQALPMTGRQGHMPLYESQLAPAPLTLGCWRPMIVMPEGLTELLDDEQLVCVLAHERAHVARHDTAIALLQQLAGIGFWWNPLLRAVNHQIDELRERICDDHVVKQFGNGRPLAEAIVKVVEWSNAVDVRLPLATTLLDDFDSIEQRITRLAERDRSLSVRLSAWSAALVGLFGIMLAAVSLVPAVRAQTAVSAKIASAPQQSSEPQVKEDAKPVEPTVLIQVRGRAKDLAGKPITGATVFLVSTNGIDKQLGETKTDAEGRYEFRDVQLPLTKPAQLLRGGTVQAYGEAVGFGVAWHGMRHYLPQPRPGYAPKEDDESAYYQGEPIEMDLTFRPVAKLIGTVKDEKGRPVADARIQLSSLDYLDNDGHEWHHNYREFWALYSLPPRYHEARTGADGRFEINGLPADTAGYVIVEHSSFATQTFFAAITDKPLTEYHFIGTASISIANGKQVRTPNWETRKVRTSPLEIRVDSTERFVMNVIHEDDGTPAKDTRVSAFSGDAAVGTSASQQTDERGRVEFALPPGKYRFNADPPRDTSYVRTKGEFEVRAGSQQQTDTVRLKAGCILILETVNAVDGSPIPGVSYWCDDDGKLRRRVGVQSSTSYVDNPVTNDKGELRVVVLPGTRHYGVGWSPLPNGYRSKPNSDKQLIECPRGKTVRVRFELSK
jgi:beta-lactamase regulating signal transducer with metallopeptidase domain